MGRQSTSLVNALYLADSTSQLMKTEFRSYLWWDLHNGAETGGDYDPTIYGWRTSGDYGILSGSNTPYPTFYAEKLLQYFARPGDSVLNGTSDYLLLSAYAVHRTNGALTLLVINKDMTTNLNAQIALTNFVPWTTATIQSYGIPQDQAAETNAAASLQDIATTNFPTAGTNFTYSFPPLSLTLFTFAARTFGAFRVGRPARTGAASPARPARHALRHSKFAGFDGVDLRLHQHARGKHFERHQPGFSGFPAPVLPRGLAALKSMRFFL